MLQHKLPPNRLLVLQAPVLSRTFPLCTTHSTVEDSASHPMSHPYCSRQLQTALKLKTLDPNIGALIIRIGFEGPLYCL